MFPTIYRKNNFHIPLKVNNASGKGKMNLQVTQPVKYDIGKKYTIFLIRCTAMLSSLPGFLPLDKMIHELVSCMTFIPGAIYYSVLSAYHTVCIDIRRGYN